jgi:hypothetical protein
MSSLEQRMRWRPGEAHPPLDVDDVLVMLGVDDRPESEQRDAVDDALTRGTLGAPSVAALRAAGWIEMRRRGGVRGTLHAWEPLVALVLISMLALVVWAIWSDDASPLLRVVATLGLALPVIVHVLVARYSAWFDRDVVPRTRR